MFFRQGFNSTDIEQMQLPFLREICLYLNDLPGLILNILYFGLEKSCHLGKYSEKNSNTHRDYQWSILIANHDYLDFLFKCSYFILHFFIFLVQKFRRLNIQKKTNQKQRTAT